MRINAGYTGFLLVATALLGSACDDSSGTNDGMGGVGGDASQSRGGRGNGGSTNASLMPETENVSPPQTTQCGETLCRDVLLGDIVISPCCASAEREACGLDLTPVEYLPIRDGCAELRQQGTRDPSCPAITFDDPVAPMDLPGCCMPSGECGVAADIELLGDFGCVDPRDFLTDAMNVPDQLPSCVPVEMDAGVPDAPDASMADDPDASTTDPMNLSDAG